MQTRTHWQDVLGHHCPRFGIDRLVAIPIPKPKGYQEGDEYKVQLSFDGERFITPWLAVLHGRAAAVPYIDVSLTRSGDGIAAVSALSLKLPKEDVSRHKEIVEEFRNTTHWPKHLLVYYHWKTAHEVDTDKGLLVLFSTGIVVTALLGLGVVQAYKRKLATFLADVTGEGVAMGHVGTIPAEKAD